MLKVGILGCGRIGQVHGRSLKQMDNAQVIAVSDFMPAAAQSLADHLGAQVRSSDEILTATDIDAVIICTPTDTHFDLIHQAAAAGKAIFCEKPIDLSTERTALCLAAVQAANVPFMTAFNRRFDPNFALLETRLRSGDIGPIELVTILSRDPSPPPISYIKSSGGIFRDMMIHDFDMARFLLGEDPVEVSATGSCLVDPAIGEAGDVDTASVTLKTASGRIAQISNSRRAAYGYDQRVEVHGAKGMLRAENILENSVEIATEAGFSRAPTMHFFLERYALAYLNEMQSFVSAVVDGTPITPSGFDGLMAQKIADAAALSMVEGRVVRLD